MSDRPDPYAALRIRDFRHFILARICITVAIQIQATIVGLQIYELTGDKLSLGLIGLAEAIPAISVSLYAGHVADSVERRKIILVALLILFLCSGALLFFTLPGGHYLLRSGTFAIYAVIFVSGIARGFLSPATFAFMPQLVSREIYANAVTLNSTFWQASSIGGPIVAGFIYAFLGISASYATDVALVVMAVIFYLTIPNRSLPPSSVEQSVMEKITSGLKFVFSNQIILSAISLDLFAVLFGGAIALLPVFAKDILHVDSVGFGFLRAAPGIGALLAAVFITHYPIQRNIGKILLWCVAGFGMCMIVFALSTSFLISIAILMMSGAFDSVSVIVRGTLIHTLTPENMKGRVSAVNSIFVGSSNEIGAFESGVAARLMGTVTSVVFGGCMTILVVGITALKAGKLRALHKVA